MKKMQNLIRKFFAIALVVASTISLNVPLTVHAEEVYSDTYWNGFCMIADHDYTVYSSTQMTTAIGKIFKGEGMTVLATGRTYGYLWVEYNTTSGPKRGYISVPVDDDASMGAAVAQVAVTSTVYYGRADQVGSYGTYQSAGTVYSGDFVAIIAKNDDWAYIEYNAANGYRKRGYVQYSNLTVFNRPGLYDDLYTHNRKGTLSSVGERFYVYSGPTKSYPQIGYVENEEVIVFDYYYDDYYTVTEYIEYSAGGQTKSGYIFIEY